MTNVPPPDPRSSQIGLDEAIAIIIALITIGAILFLTLGQKYKGFSFSRFFNPSTIARTTNAAGEPTLLSPLPAVTPLVMSPATPEALKQGAAVEAIAPTPSALPTSSLPASPTIRNLPVVTPKSVPNLPLVVPIQPTPKTEAIAPNRPGTTVQTNKYKDVPQDLWARPYIDALVAQGIMIGSPDETFQPDSPITRAEFAALLQKAFKQEPKFQSQNFKDVKPKFWASPAIQGSVKTGFLRGYPNNVFLPDQKIPKVQVLVALVNGLQLTSTPASQEVLQTYQDASQIPNYAKQPVSNATKAGLVVNYPNPKLFTPNRNATRAEVAALVYQALVKAGRVKAIPSQYLVKP